MDIVKSKWSERFKLTAMVNLYSALKLPLLAFATPTFVQLDPERVVVRIGLNYRTKNHLRSMYFGALAMGAELSIATTALTEIQKSGKRIDFIFKDFEAQFLKRADDNVLFVCEQARDVAALIVKACESSERVEGRFEGYAILEGSQETVMTYALTLSVRRRSSPPP